MIIYKIENLKNGMIYIGQTVLSFEKRYRGGWWRTTHNKRLKEDARKIGHENFSVSILEKNVFSIEKLNELEAFYIKKYKTIYPVGYNLNCGGNSSRPCRESRIKRGKFYFLKNYRTKEAIVFQNLNVFCEENKLNTRILISVLKGKRLSYKDFCLPSTNPRFWVLKNDASNETCVVFENDGRIFCREKNLPERAFERLVVGVTVQHWRVVSFSPREGFLNGKRKVPKPNGGDKFLYEKLYSNTS